MSQREPTRDELLAMAYVDGELDETGRAELEQRLATSPALRREVSTLKELELMARAAAPAEPMDHEWQRLARDPLQRGTLGLGWILLALGGLGVLGFGSFEFLRSDAPLLLRVALASAFLGLALLFGAILRGRLRTLPLDPYRKIQR